MREPIFTSAQLDAIDVNRRHQDGCVVAGPGSGKTTVLVEYFRRLVSEGIDPLRILAITFTEKAALNMRKKLGEAFARDPAVRARLERAWVSTVHGFCTRLLKENAIFAGVDPEFSVMDARDSLHMQQETMTAVMEELFERDPAAVRSLIYGLSSGGFEEAALSAYDAMRGAGVRVEQLSAFPAPPGVTLAEICATFDQLRRDPLAGWSASQREHLASIVDCGRAIAAAQQASAAQGLAALDAFASNLQKCKRGTGAYELVKVLREQIHDARYGLITELYASQRRLLLDAFGRFDHLYRERKQQAGVLDFADLEEYTVRLLEERAETRTRLQSQFDHILMDEFQDTNGQQARLLSLVRSEDRFYAVGDINQSIYGFRHAEPQVFCDYRDAVERSGKRLVHLVDNFRSRPEILRAVETVLYLAQGIEPRTLTAGRQFEAPRPLCVEVLAATVPDAEPRMVARQILELLEGPGEFAFRDVAVLLRNTEPLPAFSAAFDDAGIPYVVNRGRGFYESREVNDLTHLLRVIANPRDEVAIATVLRSPLVEASDEALLRLRLMGDNLGVALSRLNAEAAARFGEDLAKLDRFRTNLAQWRARREFVSFDRLLLDAMDDCGYGAEAGTRANANIQKFLAQARDAVGRFSLDAFVEELEFARNANAMEPDAAPEDDANAVQVMTVHSAKGLEFPIVFVAAMHKGVQTEPPVVAFSPRFGIGARWRDTADRSGKDDLFQHAIRRERTQREEEEGNRLLYVAMTRAEQHLVLSFTVNGKKGGNWDQAVANRLGLQFDEPRDEILTRTAPDGREWKLRLLVTDKAPELLRRAPALEAAEPPELLIPPPVAGQQDANATVTGLSLFANCPRRYYLAQYLGFEGRPRAMEETSDELSAGEFGTQVHALLAGNPVEQPDPEALRLADVFRQSPLGRRVSRATRIEREFDFLMAVEDLIVRGQVDLWFEEGGELAIVDYKTDAVSTAEAHERALEYAPQLRLYAMALEKVTGRAPDRAWLHFLRPNQAIPVDLSPSLLDSPETLVREFQEAQAKLEFPLIESDRCHRCPFYRDLCPAGTTAPSAAR